MIFLLVKNREGWRIKMKQVEPIHFKNEKDFLEEFLPNGIHYLKSLNTKSVMKPLEYFVEMRIEVRNKNWREEFDTKCPSIEAEELKERMAVWRINFFDKAAYWRENTDRKEQEIIEFYRIDSHLITKSLLCFRGIYDEKMASLNLGITRYNMKFPVMIFIFGTGAIAEIFGNWIWGIIYDGFFLFGYFIYRKIFLKKGIRETIQWMESFLK